MVIEMYDWIEKNSWELEERYIEKNQEDFHTDDDYCTVSESVLFQEWSEEMYNEYVEYCKLGMEDDFEIRLQ